MSGCSNMKLYGSITLQNDDEMTNTIPPVDLLHDEWMLQHEAIRKYYTAERRRNDEHHPTRRPIAWWVDAPTWSYTEGITLQNDDKMTNTIPPVDLIAWWVDALTWSYMEVLHCRTTKWRTPSHPVDLLHHEWMLQHEAIWKYYTAERRRNDEHHPTRRPIASWVDAPTWSYMEVFTLQNDEMTNTIPPVDLLHHEWMLQHEAIWKYYTAERRNDEHHPTRRPIASWVDAPTWSYTEVLHCRTTTKWRTPSHP